MATVKTTSDVTLIVETSKPETKAEQLLLERVVKTAISNYVAVTAEDVESALYHNVAKFIQENLEVKVIWK